MSLSSTSDILELFVNILVASYKRSLSNSDNLQQSVSIQLPKKQETLSEFQALSLKPT